MKWVLLLVTLLTLPLSGLAQNTTASLVLDSAVARPGETFHAAIRLQMSDGWHTYWRNPGGPGKATSIRWELPETVIPGQILWPVPEKYEFQGITTYVYHHEVLLLIPLTIASNAPSGPLALKGLVSWLECQTQCLPGKAEVSAELIIGNQSAPSSNAAMIQSWRSKIPMPDPNFNVRAEWANGTNSDHRMLTLAFQPPAGSSRWDFYPFESENYDFKPSTESFVVAGEQLLRKSVTTLEGWKESVAGLLVWEEGAARRAIEVQLEPVQSSRPVAAEAVAGTSPNNTPPRTSLWLMIISAFIGGLILNIMPCVLPVIALKILGFVNQSREQPGKVRELGLIYAVGVLLSFAALAALVIGVKSAGKAASWGMQFQNPQFVLILTALVTLVALNLFGVFEITLGGSAMGAAGQLASKEGRSGAFFNGVLATILATPCTAPFLGAALGFAFAEPAPIVLLIFLCVGAGLAFPYVLLSWNPKWLKFLPKPGVWMQRFKVAMGFPMLATALWLFSQAATHYGKGAIFSIGLFLVLVGLAVWVWGTFVQLGTRRTGLARAVAIIILLAAYFGILERGINWRHPSVSTAAAIDPKGFWQPWSLEAVAEARAAGRPVLVDFTADWCLTCQVNKTTSLEIESVKNKMKEIGAVAFLADYTRENPLITSELKKYQRAGVPLVLVFPASPAAPPIVLPEVLTPNLVLNALEAAASTKTVSANNSNL
ncbi:MAG: protein-disulfide reductase DsbD family protein [Verrucomicrobiota bacterium]|nr:protein-disulfide reductase DsbD family protein [Verrucomicrobiota bacterium]